MSSEVQPSRLTILKGSASGSENLVAQGNSRSFSSGLSRSRRLMNLAGPFFGLLLVVGLFSLSPSVRPYFLTGANFKIILTQTVIVAMGTLGMTLIIVSGGIDLSVGSTVALTSVVGATALLKGSSAWTVVVLS